MIQKTVFAALCLLCSISAAPQSQGVASEDLGYDPGATAESLGLEPYIAPEDFYPVFPWDRFPREVKPCETLESSLRGVAECGFNFAGFIIDSEYLQVCDELNLKAMLAVPADLDWKSMNDAQIDATVRDFVAQAKGHDCVIGYRILDEPGAKAFPTLAKVVAALKKYDPDRIAFINLFPEYSSCDDEKHPNSVLQAKSFTEYLERFIREVKPQLISYDNYMVEYSDDMHNLEKAASYYNNLLKVREITQKYKLPFWNVVDCNRIQDVAPPPSPARFAFQAYTTLAAGGRGLGWYTYYHRPGYSYSPIDKEGRRTVSWQYLQNITRHVRTLGPVMNRLQSTGVYFTSPAPTPNLPALPGKLVKNVQVTASPRGYIREIPPFMAGEFLGSDGHDYVMLVNLSMKYSAAFRLETVKKYRKTEWLSPMDGLPTPLNVTDAGEWVLPGHGILLRMEE
jgi:hypothetical protein